MTTQPRDAHAQLDLAGQNAPAPPPAYARDADAETVRLFDFPTTIAGQIAMETDPAA